MAASDGASAIACLAAPGAAVCTVRIDTTPPVPATTAHHGKSSAFHARVFLRAAAFFRSSPNKRASTQTTSRVATPTLLAVNNPDDRPRRYRE